MFVKIEKRRKIRHLSITSEKSTGLETSLSFRKKRNVFSYYLQICQINWINFQKNFLRILRLSSAHCYIDARITEANFKCLKRYKILRTFYWLWFISYTTLRNISYIDKENKWEKITSTRNLWLLLISPLIMRTHEYASSKHESPSSKFHDDQRDR